MYIVQQYYVNMYNFHYCLCIHTHTLGNHILITLSYTLYTANMRNNFVTKNIVWHTHKKKLGSQGGLKIKDSLFQFS